MMTKIQVSERDFRRGYYQAVAELVRMFDQPTIAAELLREFGPVNLRGIDEYDAEALKPIVEDIERLASS